MLVLEKGTISKVISFYWVVIYKSYAILPSQARLLKALGKEFSLFGKIASFWM
jgi:hypothetical protein